MRYIFICICVCAFITAWAVCGTAYAAAGDNVTEHKVGDATVWAIADSHGDRDMSAFPGADPKVVAQYVPSGKAPSAIMTFLIKTGSETILIDTGLGGSSSGLSEGLKHIGVAPEDITAVLITHMHGDHIGGLVKDGAKAFPNARVLSSKAEHDFWLNEKSAEVFPNRRTGFAMARENLGVYGASGQTFEFGADVLPGVGLKALDARGHTPGHTVFLFESNGERMLFWADLSHAAALQFPRPDINASYDMNPDEAAASRLRFMEMAAAEKLPIAGAHLPFPGVGTVEKDSEGGYLYTSR